LDSFAESANGSLIWSVYTGGCWFSDRQRHGHCDRISSLDVLTFADDSRTVTKVVVD